MPVSENAVAVIPLGGLGEVGKNMWLIETPDDIVVVNDTRVRSARLHLTKTETGGAVELLLLERLESGNWEALVRPARRALPRGPAA